MKEMATHSRIFAWEIPWTEEAGSEGTQVSFVGAYISELEADGF